MLRVGFPCSNQVGGVPCSTGPTDTEFETLENKVDENTTDIQANATLIDEVKDNILIVDVDPDFNLAENENITIWYNRTEEKLKVRDGCEIFAVTMTLDRDWCYYGYN